MDNWIGKVLVALAVCATLSSCKPSASDDSLSGVPGRLSELDTKLRERQPSPDTALLGFRLGERLDLDTCEGDPDLRIHACIISSDQQVDVFLPATERPDWLRFDSIWMSVDTQGRLEEITAPIDPKRFGYVREMAEIKYGKPDYTPFSIATAIYTWSFADMSATAYGLDEAHYVSIQTDAVRKRVQAQSDRDAAARAAEDAKKRHL